MLTLEPGFDPACDHEDPGDRRAPEASGAPDQDADCMAGGKVLVGPAYVERLQLSDAELAMVDQAPERSSR